MREALAWVAGAPRHGTDHGAWRDVKTLPAPERRDGEARRSRPKLPPRTADEGGHDWEERPGAVGCRYRCRTCGSLTDALASRRRERCRARYVAAMDRADELVFVDAVFAESGRGSFCCFY